MFGEPQLLLIINAMDYGSLRFSAFRGMGMTVMHLLLWIHCWRGTGCSFSGWKGYGMEHAPSRPVNPFTQKEHGTVVLIVNTYRHCVLRHGFAVEPVL